MRISKSLHIVALFMLVIVQLSYCTGKASANDERVLLIATDHGDFVTGNSSPWKLTIRENGKANLVLYPNFFVRPPFIDLKSIDLQISKEMMMRVKTAIAENRIDELPSSIGKAVLCGAQARSIWIFQNGRPKVVRIQSFDIADDATEVKRVLRVWAEIRALIDDKRAHDSRIDDSDHLKSVEKTKK